MPDRGDPSKTSICFIEDLSDTDMPNQKPTCLIDNRSENDMLGLRPTCLIRHLILFQYTYVSKKQIKINILKYLFFKILIGLGSDGSDGSPRGNVVNRSIMSIDLQ